MIATRGQWAWGSVVPGLGRRRAEGRRALELALEADGTWSGQVGPAGIEVRCLAGTVWLTREGDPEDRVLSAGDAFASERPGRLALMALEPARLRVARR